jgi:hypothetical protein
VLPSPPAENQGTEVARILEATARAQQVEATPTPLPYNAVIAQYIVATSTPGNAATEAARNLIATVLDTPTPLPFGFVVYTLVPPPVTVMPTATPIPPIQAVAEIPITPTPTLFVVPDKLPAYVSNKILFKSNRLGATETFALDPVTGELFRINESWVFELAQSKLGFSPDGQSQAIVHPDNNGRLQIQIRSFQYGTIRQVTSFASADKTVSYDPTWSPLGGVITFVTNDDGDDEVFTVNLDGSIHTQLTYNGPDWDKHPTWSPDGSKIVFFSNRDTGRRQLWIMNANGSGQQNLSNSAADDWDPIWINPAWVQ